MPYAAELDCYQAPKGYQCISLHTELLLVCESSLNQQHKMTCQRLFDSNAAYAEGYKGHSCKFHMGMPLSVSCFHKNGTLQQISHSHNERQLVLTNHTINNNWTLYHKFHFFLFIPHVATQNPTMQKETSPHQLLQWHIVIDFSEWTSHCIGYLPRQ